MFYVACRNTQHVHTSNEDAETGAELLFPVPLTCVDCDLAAHWDEAIGWYQHDNPDAADCFSIARDDRATSCHTGDSWRVALVHDTVI
jgi:hypothetical protein